MQKTDVKGYRLSAQQDRVWTWQGNDQAYSTQCAFWVKGELNLSVWQDALQSLVRRYEILRTVFHCFPGMELPVQVVTSNVEICCQVIDLENLSAAGQIAYIDEYLTTLRRRTLDLEARSPLFTSLLHFSREVHLAVMQLPVLCADEYTLMRMVEEQGQAYASIFKGMKQDEEALQYADIVAWQNQLLELKEAEALRAYWHKIDLSQLPTRGWPFERKEAAKGSSMTKGQKESFAPCVFGIPLEENASVRISHLAQRDSVSRESWLLACWEAVLWRLSGEQDFLVGVACNGRVYEGLTEELAKGLGLYTQIVPVGATLHENLRFDQLVTSVNKSLSETVKWQIYFTWKEEAKSEARSGDSTLSFFPICFEYTCWPGSLIVGELSLSLHQRFCCTEPFALKLSVLQVGESLQLELYADPQRISSVQARRLATALQALIQGAIAQPQTSLSTLPILAPDKRTSLLMAGYAPTRPLPPQGFCQLFEEQVRRFPNSLAVISAQGQLTYRQLNERANQLALVLRQQGVGPNVLVGLCLARDIHMLVGLLGILKAQGAYVPLDPEIPSARVSYQLQESKAALLLTQREVNTPRLGWGGKTLYLEDLEQEMSHVPASDLPGGGAAEDLAYVIYTSGSTGMPKGVMIQQSSLVNYTLALCELLGAEPGWQYATVSTLAADLGNTAIFCALASGGCVHVLDYETVTSVEKMARWVERHPIDVLKIVPSHLSALLTGEQAGELVPGRALVLGGEEVPLSLLERLQELGGSCQIYNHYGPTETTIGELVNPLGMLGAAIEERKGTDTRVPLGKPITNTEIYILDQWMQVVPEGMMGEIYIGGAGLAIGYIEQAEQTAEHFVPHPWSLHAGARLYRTGDLARYNEHGTIDFVGRRDRQVKLRGYRIELAEIQAVLSRHWQIHSSVVVLREDVPGEPRLVSYVVARQHLSLSPEQLREFLRQSLPEYMVPAIYVQVEALPLTANGKLDWQNLPVPEQMSHKEQSIIAGPRSPVEEMLVQVWRDLLGVPELGIHDHFFLMGGHSLLATRVMAQIQAILQVALPVQILFEAPTVAELAQRIEQNVQQNEGIQVPSLVVMERPDEIPLSFAQQRLWFLDQLEPGTTSYLNPRALHFQGKVTIKALEQSLQELTRRHESLRTTFVVRAGQPTQVIHPAGHHPLPLIDLQGLRQEDRKAVTQTLVRQERQRPCDLEKGPLLRVYLLRLAVQEHVLLLTLHHIITDGWSNGVLTQELTALYQAFVAGRPSPLAPLAIQYADYALWQRQWLQGEALEVQLAYWRKHLADLAPLALPTDHPRPAMQTYRGAIQSWEVPAALSERLITLSRQEDVTVFMLLLAALQILLMRYSGQMDISVGTPIANRRQVELEGLIGFFVNTLVLRTDLSGNRTFAEVLRRVRAICLQAYAHQDIPFEQVVEELEPERDLSRSPLFQIMFVFQNSVRESEALGGVKIEPLATKSTTSKFDLTLSVTQTEQRLHCTLEYNTDLFEAETIRRMLGHWQILLEGIVHNPQMHLADLPLLTQAEREQLVVQWNAMQGDDLPDSCIHQLFEQQVERTPDAVALIFEEKVLTYADLNRRANKLAHYLQELGIEPDTLVGICMERCIEMVIGLLAILKAGGAYVPLDPTYPDERLAFLVQDAHIAVVLKLYNRQTIAPSVSTTVVSLEQLWPFLEQQREPIPVCNVCPQNLAYGIYTSGSTGQPKGVLTSHKALADHCRSIVRAYDLQPDDRVLQFSPFAFDASLEQVFPTLLSGASLVLRDEAVWSPAEFHKKAQEFGLTVIDLPTAYWYQVVQEWVNISESRLASQLKLVIVGGDWIEPKYLHLWTQTPMHSARLLNAYGLTETTITATLFEIPFRFDNHRSLEKVPIGRPLANRSVYILDLHGHPVPIGVPGELYIGGTLLARGYLNHPELTAERFIPDAFSAEPNARLYKTGDLARYLPDGNIDYLGRMDQQVKLRGYRIELGEIEAVLGQHPAIQDVVVFAHEGEPGEKRLVAYLVMQSQQRLTVTDLRSFLQERLPEYMLPAAFVMLDALPLTPNGKVDRRALPGREQVQDEEQRAWEGGRTPIEDLLMGIWAEVLGRKQVGSHEQFFELGGHSLLATRLIARVRTLLGVEVPLRAVFEAPTLAGFAHRVEQSLYQSQGTPMPALNIIPRPEYLPLSFAQQRLWFLDQLEPESRAYLIAGAYQLHGMIEVKYFEHSLQELIRRHESLRTTFSLHGEQPVQVIHPPTHYCVPVIDLENVREDERIQVVRQLSEQEAQRPCNLTEGPLMRAALLRLGRQEHVLLLTLHHIITDGWSMEVLVRELTILYRAFVAGQPSPLATLAIQYADYALWQRHWLQGEVLEVQLAYWSKQLADLVPLALPTDHPRPAVQTHRGAAQSLHLAAPLSEQLMVLSRQEDVTPFMLLLAALQVLLMHSSGQVDISVGTPIANRRQAELEGVIGFFVNTLVLRTNLSGNPSFREVLQRVREVCLGAYAHQDIPFEQVVEELEPERDLSRSPLFQVLFVFQNHASEPGDIAGVKVEPLMVESRTSKFDLTLSMTQTEQGVRGRLEYNTDLFEAETIIRMLDHWQTLLEGIVQNPQAPLSELPWLMEEEREQLLIQWNATRRDSPTELCVHQLFEQQVERTPDAVALVFEEKALTYADLNRRANQLAHYLQDMGVGPEVLVGVCLERSLELTVVLLAVLKAGGAYVPLDPSYPEERLTFMVADAHVSVLLTHQRLLKQMPLSVAHVLFVEQVWEKLICLSSQNPMSNVTVENLAYVIYTSGSTGIPKGAMNTQRGIRNHLMWMQDTYGLTTQDCVVQKTPFSFDVSVWEFFWPLLNGARLVVARPDGHRDPDYLASLILQEQVTTIHFVPSMLWAFLSTQQVGACQSLRYVMCGGEVLPLELQKSFFTHLDAQLSNLYGPTEAAIDVISWICLREGQYSSLPIGRPIANTKVYILDVYLQPVPVGVAGELYIGGVGVGRGYLNHPEWTAERFIPDAFSAEPNARLYKTGDLACYLPDGNIDYLGRMDQQVKLRGYRIELGEIEAVLGQHPAIQDVVVLAREEEPGEKRLVAYLVMQQERLMVADLRSYLQDRLPAYMLPSAFVMLDALPLMPNGKIDRRALPAPERVQDGEQRWHQGGRTPIEDLLMGIWAEVLGRQQVGSHDQFFDLGGHSLLATRLIARVRTLLGVEVPLRAVFEAPTLAGFAHRVEQVLYQSQGMPPLPALNIVPRPEHLPLSFAQQRLWFLDQLESESRAYLIAGSYRLHGMIEVKHFEQSVGELIRRHESLRTTFSLHAEQPVQIIHPPRRYCVAVIDLENVGEDEQTQIVQQIAAQEAHRPCNLTQGPLMRTFLLRLGRQEHVLLLTLHHIITDGWSSGVLVRELSTLYRAFVAGQPSPLATLPIQYADYALWQRQWLQGEVLETQLAYWSKQLADLTPLALPTDHPRPAMQTYRGATQSRLLSASLSQHLQALSRQEDMTMFMLLLSALQVLLMRYSGQEDISVGTPIANRRQAELEGVIGFFVNTLVLRTDLSGNPSFREALQRVREVCLGAYAHQDLPFEQVVEKLETERDLSRSPLFQVLFVFQNDASEPEVLGDVRVEPLVVESITSKFDLTLSMTQTEQGLHCRLEYNTDLFEAETIGRMLDHWQMLLEGIVQNPQIHLSDLPLLTQAEREQLLVQWNATQGDDPLEQCVHQLFEQQVERTPDAVALVFEETALTYADLNRRANQLAHYLQELGVGPERLVGICMERSLEMVIGLLAILKAGGAYVPLDPSYPSERLAFMQQDAHIQVLLTQQALCGQLPLSQGHLMVLEEVWERLIGQPDQNPIGTVAPENLAYVIYTSGSTGVPKGVQVMHRNVANFFLGMDDTLGEHITGIWLAVTSISFDISVLELFWTLTRGFQVVVQPDNHVLSPLQPVQRKVVPTETLPTRIRKFGITHLQSTPSLASLFVVEAEMSGPLDSLQYLLLGGEALPVSLIRQLSKVMMGTIYNMYGPTETTIWSTTHRIDKRARTVAIGRPILNTQIYILDNALHVLPIGVAGALYIGGHGVVRGYVNAPDLTAEKFLPDPFSSQARALIYRTGDLARYRADGTIEYLGRMDQQVKLRGYRIELGEIEAVLERHSAIQEAVVLAREEGAVEKRLVAYLVVQPGQLLTVTDLRSYLQDCLPVYMLPSAFVMLDTLPLTPNGKVDRRALPAPEQMQDGESRAWEGGKTPIEDLLMGIWAEVLGRKQVGRHEHFFELGGHSLLATRLIARVRAMLEVEVPLRAVFEAPTLAGFAQWVQEVLGKEEKMRVPLLMAVARPETIPLSFAQQRLWFLNQLEAGSTAYLSPQAQRFFGDLNAKALEQSLQELVHRHEILRTIFLERTGQPIQVICSADHFTVPVIDLQGLGAEQREQEARSLARQERQCLCDLAKGPLLRVYMVRLERQEHVMLLTLHHIITDGWSNQIVVRELTTLYRAFVAGQPSPLVPLPVQYADYTLWQRHWLQGEVLEAQLAYWRKQLADLAPLALPTDHPRPAEQTHQGAIQSRQLSEALSEELLSLGRRENVTLFMILLAAFQVLLARYSSLEDIAVGTPIANRDRVEIENVIGFFLNTLVLRTDLSGNPSFREVLQRVREVCLGAYAHQDIPFEKVVEDLEPTRDLSRSPLFQVLLVLQNDAGELGDLAGVKIEPLEVESITSKFDLSISITRTRQHLHCDLEYNTDLFEAETIGRMLDHWQTLLEGIVQNPQMHLSDLPLLTQAEREQLLVQWNATQRDSSGELCIHQLFEQQVERTPDAVALVFEEQALTYADLNRRANQLAHYLQELGVGPERLVGICMERSLELVIGVLAILKAGGAYVPLDPSYPSERLAFMLQDAHIQVLLTQQVLRGQLPLSQGHLMVLEEVWERLIGQPDQNPIGTVAPENLAYVIYTSGSTGAPKGVLVPHANVHRLFTMTQSWFQFQAGDVWTLFHSSAFDFSVWEIWGALLHGGRLVIVPYWISRSPDVFYELLSDQQVTVLNQTPSAFHQLMQVKEEKQTLGNLALRLVIFGGEALDLQSLQPWVKRYGDQQPRLVNMYGITETTVHVTSRQLSQTDLNGGAGSLIGRAIPDLQLYILDTHHNLVPIGVPGELYVGGQGLARGYWYRPELTAERFMPHPWSQEPGARLYRTGDLVRYRSDGDIEYLGRVDQQVKIRGYRIELGEIEATLMKHPAVQDAIVLTYENDTDEKHLVAYVVGAKMLTRSELREYLQEKLPDYMGPTFFVQLDAFPLTSHGKVDRHALPTPKRSEIQIDNHIIAARTALEEIVLAIYREVLEVEQISIHDNFFDRGGHSLLAIRVISRVRAIIDVELSVRSLFETPSVAGLAGQIERTLQGGLSRAMPPLVPVAREHSVPLSFAQQRLWFLDQLEPGSTAYLILSALRLQGDLNLTALERSLQEMVKRHESLRTTFEMGTQGPVQVIHPVGFSPVPLINLMGLRQEHREKEAQLLARQEARCPCELASGPLLRIHVVRLQVQEHVLLLTLHHIITDGWSMGVLVRELTILYQAFVAGQPSPLAPLAIQYADYALWQRHWLQGEVLEAQLAYWSKQLADLAPLALPTDHPRPAVQTYRGATHSQFLSASLSQHLQALSRQEDVTVFMLLLAALQVLLMRYSGQEDISVGTPIANRRQAELEEVIGFFVNTLVLRTDLSGNPSFREVLQRVREICLGAYTHQDLPFEQVVEKLEPERDLSRSPLFQVMFVFQNDTGELEDVVGVKVEPLVVESITSKFDLTLSMTQTEQGLHCHLEYNTDLFEAETITRMLDHWQILLEGIVQNPLAHVWELPWLTQGEREQGLMQWNATQRDDPLEQCVHQLFEQQVERTPDAVALVFEQEQLTYSQLNRRANQLAHCLQELGVGPEQLVGICLERSLEMVIGLLAVLKAGGAYVPLDPGYPNERLAFMLQDAHIQVLLTQQALRGQLSASQGHLIVLEEMWERLASQPDQNPVSAVSVENLAYIIYTSGSTGNPKGVQVTHQGLDNLGLAQAHSFAVGPESRVLQFASFSFDASIWEILMALLVGASLYLELADQLLPGPDLLQVLQEQGITTVTLPPSALAVLPDEDLPTLETVVVAGEACPVALMTRWAVGRSFFNAYGPTEATVCATLIECSVEQVNQRSLSLGQPLVNVQVYLLDRYLQPVPFGVPGEICLGGMGLARGYGGLPELTAERFVPHPWSQEPGVRLYRTRDLARYQPDGTLEFLGRMDRQVKLRGYRIELGEIETVLGQHPAIQDVVVLARAEEPGEKRLVAYLVMLPQQRLTVADLRSYLQERLPVYMLPAAFVMLDALPLMPNGKVDRGALPAPEQVQDEEPRRHQGSRTPIEDLLMGIWAEVLGRKQVGSHEHFFELGGHSLLATRLIARVRTLLGVEVPLRAVFEVPTLAGFADRIEQIFYQNQGMPLPALSALARPEQIPLSFAQQRLWFLDQLEPESSAYLIAGSYRLQGMIEVKHFEQSLQELIQRHESLRTTFSLHAEQPVQIIHPPRSYCLPVIDLENVREDERTQIGRQLAMQEAHHPCNLTEGPLMRTFLLRLGRQDHVLLLTLHHIITDGWSTEVLVRELTILYQAFVAGDPSPLVPLPIQYADYALWQRRWLQGEILQQHIEYWKKQLWRARPLELPTNSAYTALRDNRGATYSFQFPTLLSEEMMRVSLQEEVTLFMLLLAAFQVVLYRLTDQTDIVIGTDVANRTHVETEGLIGFFVNLLALRTDLQGAPGFREVLQQVRAMMLGAYTHQELPFDQMVEQLQIERSKDQTPLVRALFVLQNASGSVEKLPGITIESMQGAHPTARFDLAFFLYEGAQEIGGVVVYRTELFEELAIITLVHRLEALVRDAMLRPDISIDELEISTDEEKAKQVNYEEELYSVDRKQLQRGKRKAIDIPENRSWEIK